MTTSKFPVRAAALLLLVLAFTMVACGDESEPEGGGGDSEVYVPPPTEQDSAPEAEAGEQAKAPPANANANLSSGAFGGPQPQVTTWTAQEASDGLYQDGIVWDDGTEHDPNYVSCTGAGAPSDDEGTEFSSFDCLVEVPDLAPYEVTLSLEQDGTATVEFVAYA